MVPFLAFDLQKNRIGFGGGYYDTTISFYKKQYPKTLFCGIGYDI